jgi:quercetin dioxygenase-like cupin family protein
LVAAVARFKFKKKNTAEGDAHDDPQTCDCRHWRVRGVAAAAGAAAQTVLPARSNGTMEIKRSGPQPSRKGPAEYFTGAVRVVPLFQAGDPPRVSGGQVTFEPGSRTAWHTHPLGQTLLITSGLGWVQHEGGPIEEVRPGDVVWFPAGVKH